MFLLFNNLLNCSLSFHNRRHQQEAIHRHISKLTITGIGGETRSKFLPRSVVYRHSSKNKNSNSKTTYNIKRIMVGRSLDMDGQSEMLNNNQVKSKEDLACQPVQHLRKLYGPVGIVVVLILLTAIILIAVGSSMGSESREQINPGTIQDDVNAASITLEPTSSPTNSPTLYQDVAMTEFFMEALGDDDVKAARILVTGTVQWKAKRWLVHDDPLALDPADNSVPRWRILQRYAIATTHFSFLGEDDLNLDWMSIDECESVHINCDDNGYIRALEIGEY